LGKTISLNCASGEIIVGGEADIAELEKIPKDHLSSATVLIDIEGFEYEFLTDGVLNLLANSYVIIELHPWLSKDPVGCNKSLFDMRSKYFDIDVVTTGVRDMSGFQELANFTDDDRWLCASESRAYLMDWLVLKPQSRSLSVD
jgi:hypothetical protein